MDLQGGSRQRLNAALKDEAAGGDVANLLEGGAEILSADRTLTREDHNKVFIVAAVDLTATLPSTIAGFHCTFFVRTPSATTGFSVSPAAADKIEFKGGTAVDDKDVINTAATDALGDMIELWGDGSVGWVAQVTGTWADEA